MGLQLMWLGSLLLAGWQRQVFGRQVTVAGAVAVNINSYSCSQGVLLLCMPVSASLLAFIVDSAETLEICQEGPFLC